MLVASMITPRMRAKQRIVNIEECIGEQLMKWKMSEEAN
jgi:hypothetical protein